MERGSLDLYHTKRDLQVLFKLLLLRPIPDSNKYSALSLGFNLEYAQI